jgi:hypothetical protein
MPKYKLNKEALIVAFFRLLSLLLRYFYVSLAPAFYFLNSLTHQNILRYITKSYKNPSGQVVETLTLEGYEILHFGVL